MLMAALHGQLRQEKAPKWLTNTRHHTEYTSATVPLAQLECHGVKFSSLVPGFILFKGPQDPYSHALAAPRTTLLAFPRDFYSIMFLKMDSRRSRCLKDGLKTTQDRLKTPQDRPKTASRLPQDPPDPPKSLKNHWFFNVFGGSPDGHKNGPKTRATLNPSLPRAENPKVGDGATLNPPKQSGTQDRFHTPPRTP